MNSLRRSFWFALADNHLGITFQFISSLVIARVLTPAEIGIFSVAAVIAALASAFRDFGLAEYLIQSRTLTHLRIRAAFTVNLATSWTAGLLLLAISPIVADFYRHAGVGAVMRLQAINFFLIPFGAISMAYHRRNLNYRPMFFAGLVSNAIAFVVAIAAALSGLSYMSMAWSSLAGTASYVVMAVLQRPRGLPYLPSFKGTPGVLRFGAHAVTIYLLGQAGRAAPELCIGRLLDLQSVALYGRADGLVEIFRRLLLNTAGKLYLPFLAHAKRNGVPLRQGYLDALDFLAAIGWPFLGSMGLIAEGLIRLLYGPQWGASVPVAHILCGAAILRLPYLFTGEALIAAGRIDLSHRLQWINLLSLFPMLALIVPFGLIGAAWGVFASSIISSVIAQRYLDRHMDVAFSLLIARLQRPFIILLFSLAPAAILSLIADQAIDFPWFIPLAALLTFAAWVSAIIILQHPLSRELLSLLATIRKLLLRQP